MSGVPSTELVDTISPSEGVVTSVLITKDDVLSGKTGIVVEASIPTYDAVAVASTLNDVTKAVLVTNDDSEKAGWISSDDVMTGFSGPVDVTTDGCNEKGNLTSY